MPDEDDTALPMGEILKGAEARAKVDAIVDGPTSEIAAIAATEAEAQRSPAIIYNTETTEAARTLLNQVGRLDRLISEDDSELAHIADEYSRQSDDIERRYEDERRSLMEASSNASELVRERRRDRETARAAFNRVLDGLQEKGRG